MKPKSKKKRDKKSPTWTSSGSSQLQKKGKKKCIDGDSNPGRVESVNHLGTGDEWQRLMIPLHYQCLYEFRVYCCIYDAAV